MASRTTFSSLLFCPLPLGATVVLSLAVGLTLTCPLPASAQEVVGAEISGRSHFVATEVDPLEASIKAIEQWPVAQVGEHGIESAEFIYPSENPPTPTCHASTIVDTPDG